LQATLAALADDPGLYLGGLVVDTESLLTKVATAIYNHCREDSIILIGSLWA